MLAFKTRSIRSVSVIKKIEMLFLSQWSVLAIGDARGVGELEKGAKALNSH